MRAFLLEGSFFIYNKLTKKEKYCIILLCIENIHGLFLISFFFFFMNKEKLRHENKTVLQNLGLMRRVMSFKLMIPFFKIDIKKIIF